MAALARPSRPLIERLVLLAACAPMLAACATGKVRMADTRLPPAFEAPAPAAKAPPEVLDRWWRLYDDAQLTQLVEQALADSPDAKDAAAKLDQARAVRAAALLSYNPQGALTASATKEQLNLLEPAPAFAQALGGSTLATGGLDAASGAGGLGVGAFGLASSQTEQAGFSVSWELDLFGRRQAAKKSADADLRAAVFTAAATRWSLSADVADSLFQARGLALQLVEAQNTLRDEQQLLDIAKAKADRGLTPTSDVAQTESDVLSAQAEAESFTAQLTAARRSLLLLVGRGVDPLASLPVPAAVGSPPPVPAALPGELLVRRPDVLVAQQQVVSATGKLSLDQRAFLPTFTLEPGVGLLQETASAASRLSFWSLGASASQPVLDMPRLLALTRQQRAVAEQAMIAYEKAVQTAYGDAESAFVYFASDSRRLDLLKAAERDADTAYQAKLTGYQRGLNDLQSTLTAEASWREARIARASAETTLMQRSVQVFKALGGGWTPDAPKNAAITPAKQAAG